MTVPAKLAGFALGLAVLFGGGALAGGAVDPDRDPAPAHAGESTGTDGGHGTEAQGQAPSAAKAPQLVRGLAVADAGLRLDLARPELRRGRTAKLRFRILDERGATVRDFDVEHEKRMHLILARRDLTGFQHLHPEQLEDGSWGAAARLDVAGSYRLFADFSHAGTARTLATDLRVDGNADLRDLPAPAATAVSDGGYDVRLESGSARPGREAELKFSIARDGRAVRTEPYLGAGGHLVALREGDLAFLHVHPTEHGDGETSDEAHDDAIGFAATFPTAGRYRLFLQFKHEGRLQTVAFTREVR